VSFFGVKFCVRLRIPADSLGQGLMILLLFKRVLTFHFSNIYCIYDQIKVASLIAA